eukprot:1313671-Prymnesium_polylepis.1
MWRFMRFRSQRWAPRAAAFRVSFFAPRFVPRCSGGGSGGMWWQSELRGEGLMNSSPASAASTFHES